MSQIPTLTDCRRIVIKIGSLMLADSETGEVRTDWLKSLAADIAALRASGVEGVVVSSGAVTLGRPVLGLMHQSLELSQKQACAACGQIRLVEAWQSALAEHNIPVAQILITAEDTEDRRRYLNARSTLTSLIEMGVVPIINENDTITTEEIRYGDNDRLAASVAAIVGADALVLLSDIDGFYTANPKLDPSASLIPVIDQITPDIEAMAGDAIGQYSTGGMKTKVMAAQRAVSAGCHMVISQGDIPSPLQHIIGGGRCTWFRASETPLSAYKQWIASSVQIRGTLTIDHGAARALAQGNSLLPAGVTAIEGHFDRGDTVEIRDQSGSLLGSGLAIYPAADAARIIGKQSDAIEAILGYKRRDELIHRDDMVVL